MLRDCPSIRRSRASTAHTPSLRSIARGVPDDGAHTGAWPCDRWPAPERPAQGLACIGTVHHNDVTYPFRLEQQQTTSLDRVARALEGLRYPYAADDASTAFEAVFQAASGVGFDDNCDDAFEVLQDVLPFRATPSDAFGGITPGKNDPSTPGTGDRGGMGFREGAFPLLVIVSHRELLERPHGGCANKASNTDAAVAMAEIGAKVVGIAGDVWLGHRETEAQLRDFAILTDSYFDLDGDGVREPAVVTWDGSEEAFDKAFIDGIVLLVGNATFDVVRLHLEDPEGVIVLVAPEYYGPVTAGSPLPFTLEIAGAVVPAPGTGSGSVEVTAELVADDAIVLSRRTLHVVPTDRPPQNCSPRGVACSGPSLTFEN
ncbi:MAG: hypothetical protein ACI8PZ_004143 [Myxococcota bacterium]|jgi:hypothetical protein